MKVLFLDSVHKILQEQLDANGFDCSQNYTIPREELLKEIEHYQGIIIRSRLTIDKEFLKHAKNLKFIARSGAGLENIDLNEAKKKGVEVFNSPEGNRDAVGEHALGMLLMLMNNLKQGDKEVRKGVWLREENRGFEISGKTIGIIGYGNMGSAFAEKLQGFSCKVIAYDKYKSDFGNAFVEECSLEDIFLEADILSMHVHLTEETQMMVNEKFLNSFKKPIYIINTARGAIMNTEALIDGLEGGKILGACLDVLEYEKKSFEKLDFDSLPKAFQELVESNKVVLSPHVAGWTYESYGKLSSYLADKILAKFSA